jgi:hypothetical protein
MNNINNVKKNDYQTAAIVDAMLPITAYLNKKNKFYTNFLINIKDHIRNFRVLNEQHLLFIKDKLTNEDKNDIIELLHQCNTILHELNDK